jgi:O-6-methylguanine DNA methyltransferase
MDQEMVRYSLLRTVLDPLLAVSGPRGLVRLEFLPDAWEYHIRAHAIARQAFPPALQQEAAAGADGPVADSSPLAILEDDDHFFPLRDQLAEYFTGQRDHFDLALDIQGTDFQVRVWKQLLNIPYGKLRTYGQVARKMRKPKATRAVGQAAGQNPLPILIPCHRVIGKGGSLVGFAGGISTKARLLRLEGHTLGQSTRIEEPRLF